MAKSLEQDSGLGSGNTAQQREEIFGSLTNEVSKSVIALYNKNSDNGETDEVALWAAEQITKLSAHVANFTAAKIIRQIQERRRRSARGGLAEAFAAALMMSLLEDGEPASGPRSGSAVSDNSTSEIKYPWMKGEELGRGGFGVVFRAKGPDGFSFAVKEVEREGKEAECLRDEIKCLTKLSHINIVKCYGFAEGGGKIYMYLELLNGSVTDKMNKSDKACTTLEARKYTSDVVRGLAYLHNKNIIHRDIKCGNVLLDRSGRAKLGDMGLSKPHLQQTVADYNETAGSILWMSPEALTKKLIGKRADIWSLGCAVYEMLKKAPPFADLGIMGFIVLTSGPRGGSIKHFELISQDKSLPGILKSFLLQIFVPFEKRPFVETIARHKWLC